jgi:hypothetical protein
MKDQWWNFYLIRYAMGSVFGTLLIYVIFLLSPATSSILFIPEPKDLNLAHLTLWFALGIAYCYVASLPILTLHASRFILMDPDKKSRRRHSWIRILILLLSLVFTYFVTKDMSLHGGKKAILFLGFLSFLFVVMNSMYLVLHMLFIERSYEYTILRLRELAFQRASANPANKEYIETYKHLREHGNAFAILLMELLLAASLAAALLLSEHLEKYLIIPSDKNLWTSYVVLLVLTIWCLPGYAVWVFGQRIEAELWKKT